MVADAAQFGAIVLSAFLFLRWACKRYISQMERVGWGDEYEEQI